MFATASGAPSFSPPALFDLAEADAAALDVGRGEALIVAGEPAGGLYLVDAGSFDVIVAREGHSIVVGSVGPGAVLGEISLLAGGRPSASVVATTPGRVRRIEPDTARHLLEGESDFGDDLAEEARLRINQNELALIVAELAGTDDGAVIRDVLVQMGGEAVSAEGPPTSVRYAAGELIFSQGDAPDLVYVVEEGEVAIFREHVDGSEEPIATIPPGQYFGELGPLLGFPRSASARAIGATRLTTYGPQEFRRTILGD